MAKTNKIQQKKIAILDALEKSLGVVTTACKMVGVDRTTFYKYLNEDPEFAAKVKDMQEVALDFVESQLLRNIKRGKEASAIFYMKTKGKARGYVERSEHEITAGEIQVTINRTVIDAGDA